MDKCDKKWIDSFGWGSVGNSPMLSSWEMMYSPVKIMSAAHEDEHNARKQAAQDRLTYPRPGGHVTLSLSHAGAVQLSWRERKLLLSLKTKVWVETKRKRLTDRGSQLDNTEYLTWSWSFFFQFFNFMNAKPQKYRFCGTGTCSAEYTTYHWDHWPPFQLCLSVSSHVYFW